MGIILFQLLQSLQIGIKIILIFLNKIQFPFLKLFKEEKNMLSMK